MWNEVFRDQCFPSSTDRALCSCPAGAVCRQEVSVGSWSTEGKLDASSVPWPADSQGRQVQRSAGCRLKPVMKQHSSFQTGILKGGKHSCEWSHSLECSVSLCRAVQVPGMCPKQCNRGLLSQCHRGPVLTPDLLPFHCLGGAEREKQNPEGLEEPAGGVLKSRKG